MRRIDFKVPIYDWDITVATIYDCNDYNSVKSLLEEIDAEPTGKEWVLNNVEKEAINGGDTWYDTGIRKIVCIIFKWTEPIEFWTVLNHEKRHMVDRIMEHHGINDTESAAYLDGYLTTQIYSRINELK